MGKAFLFMCDRGSNSRHHISDTKLEASLCQFNYKTQKGWGGFLSSSNNAEHVPRHRDSKFALGGKDAHKMQINSSNPGPAPSASSTYATRLQAAWPFIWNISYMYRTKSISVGFLKKMSQDRTKSLKPAGGMIESIHIWSCFRRWWWRWLVVLLAKAATVPECRFLDRMANRMCESWVVEAN
jgi:hypothetical protein